MNLQESKRRLKIMLSIISPEQYEAVKRCVTVGGGLALTARLDEKYQIRIELEDALSNLWQACQWSNTDFEKAIIEWGASDDHRLTVACFLLRGKFKEIQDIADSI